MKPKLIPISCKRIPYPTGVNMGYASDYALLVANKVIELKTKQNINIICTGSSGIILSSLLYINLQKHYKEKRNTKHISIIHIKKPGEKAHSNNVALTSFDAEKATNIIIDDFACTGETIERIYKQVIKTCDKIKIDMLVLSFIDWNNCIEFIDDVMKPKMVITSEADVKDYNAEIEWLNRKKK